MNIYMYICVYVYIVRGFIVMAYKNIIYEHISTHILICNIVTHVFPPY